MFLNNKNLLKNIKNSSISINKIFKEINIFYTDIKDNIDEENFFGKSFDSCNLENIFNKFKKLDPKLLDDWTEFLNVKKNNSSCENVLLDSFDKNQLKYEDLKSIFFALYYNYLLKHSYKENPNLSNYNGQKLDSLRIEYSEIDKIITSKKKDNLKNIKGFQKLSPISS